MDPFTALMIAGTAMQVYGNVKANLDESRAEAENAIWMRQQAEFIKKSTERSKDIFNRESQDNLAGLENSFAKSGISMSGSALELKIQEEWKRDQELQAIIDQGNMNMQEAYMKASTSQRNSDTIGSLTHNGLQSATSIVNARADYVKAGGPAMAAKYKQEQADKNKPKGWG